MHAWCSPRWWNAPCLLLTELMARIVFGSYLVRYPLGGMMSHVLQYLVGFQRLGHEVVFVEKAGYARSCFDPVRHVMSDDCTHGTRVVNALLARFGLEARWCFVDAAGQYHGLRREAVNRAFRDADVFVDMGSHGAWLDEAQTCGLRVLIDGEPGFNQIRMERGQLDPERGYDYYFTNGRNVGTVASAAPSAGRVWRPLFHPVVPELFANGEIPLDGPFSTIMNWQSHEAIDYRGVTYGQKDREFEKFCLLPRRVDARLELAVSGRAPRPALEEAGWAVRDGHQVTVSFDAFRDYLRRSRGEFSVAKHVFVAFWTGWFSDRSAAYLAAGRPVVMQDTGFSAHLPTGDGLFAVTSVEEAAEALRAICADPAHHAHAAACIARTHLDARIVLRDFLAAVGVGADGASAS
jgi:hypothetical protein